MRSLGVDKNDFNQLKWSRFGNMGACVASEYYQNCPYFFTREGASMPLVGIFRGRSAFLIASGPSFNNIDKNKLLLPGIWTITTNNAIASFRGNASIIVDDPARFTMSLWVDPTVMKFVPMSLLEKPIWDNRYLEENGGQQWAPAGMVLGDCPNIIGYRRNEKFVAERFLYEDTINWGCHKKWGGGRSVLLATMRILFLLGFRKVYLLGVDFEMSQTKKYSFDEERTPSAIRGNMSTYEKMIGWFKELQPYFLAENFIVKNCNPESRLTAFPFIPFEEAIKEATSEIGDPSKEQTRGMYTTFEEKIAALDAEKKKRIEESKKTENIQPQQPKNNIVVSDPVVGTPKVIFQPPQNMPSKEQGTVLVNQNFKPIGIKDIKM